MRIFLLASVFILVSIRLVSQNPHYEWASRIGSNNFDEGSFINTDGAGNVYTLGYFEGTCDFDPGAGISTLTSSGWNFHDVFIQKLDNNGTFIWAKAMGGNSNDFGNSLAIDAAGQIFTLGNYLNTADFNPGPGINELTSVGGIDIFIQKMDYFGNFLWAKSFGGNYHDDGTYISIDPTGNVFVTGGFEGIVDFDPDTGTFYLDAGVSYTDIFIQKLDNNGNFLWAKSISAFGDNYGSSLTIDASGNVYITGIYEGIADFDPDPVATSYLTAVGQSDVFILKLDANGNFIWAKSVGGSFVDIGNSISSDSNGNIILIGNFNSTADFDPGPGVSSLTSHGADDIFVLKLDSNGNYLWVKQIGGNTHDNGQSVTTDYNGNIYTTGNFKGSVDFDPGIGIKILNSPSQYLNSIFIQKLSENGNFQWAKSIGGNGQAKGNSITTDATGNVFTTGYFSDAADFNSSSGINNLLSAGLSDVFVHKVSQIPCTPNTGIDNITACDDYTWINGVNYTSNNSSATCTLTSVAGCDSVVSLNLTINKVSDVSTTTNGTLITANNSNATYQWLDCDNNYSVINGETDQSISADLFGNYAVELTENGCVDTSACINILSSSLLDDVYSEIKIIPNPNKGDFTLDLGKYSTSKVLLYDTHGNLIYSFDDLQNVSKHTFDLDLSSGLYIMQVFIGDKKKVIKLLID